ncbi:hypothetical protein [Arthrobacter sp. L77]|uniref:hypothetical protein n=1 Tax=Arthrobacter sp. L77 TaxID=1496689 RepID=UPI0005BC95F1|nr:hypothetical protein [Arthrobacter sp. L77]
MDEATPYRSALLVASGGRDALVHQLTAETDALLEHLEGTVARLALAHRAGAPDTETRLTDDDAFVWVQQSIEDIAATLRGLVLERSREHPAETPLHACPDRA